jgi:hypothetical protein
MSRPKNYLVIKNYELTDSFFTACDPETMAKIPGKYAQLQNLCVLSAQKNLVDLDAIIIDRKTVEHDQYMFKDHMQIIDDRYHSENCNILYCDLDVMFVAPTHVFGKFHHFCMLEHQCGIRYYPAGGVPEELWDIQREEMKTWDETLGPRLGADLGSPYVWDREQEIYKKMINRVLDTVGVSNLGEPRRSLEDFWQLIHCVYNPWKEDKQSTMVHYNGTGQQFDAVELGHKMWAMAQGNRRSEIRDMLNQHPYVEFIPVP